MSDLTWDEYCAEAVKTAPQQSWDEQAKQAILGLSGEAREVAEAGDGSRAAELGDCFWYLALACDAMGLRDIHMQGMAGAGADSLTDTALALAESAESLFYQSDASAGDDIKRLLWTAYLQACEMVDGDPADIWADNIRKLRDRHGSSFSPADEQDR